MISTTLQCNISKGCESLSTKSQLLKGILEGCILAIIEKEDVYGYELMQKLEQHGFTFVSEGSIYPLLLRLQKEKLIQGEMRKSDTGPNRKYYFLTDTGRCTLATIRKDWVEISTPVTSLLFQKGDD